MIRNAADARSEQVRLEAAQNPAFPGCAFSHITMRSVCIHATRVSLWIWRALATKVGSSIEEHTPFAELIFLYFADNSPKRESTVARLLRPKKVDNALGASLPGHPSWHRWPWLQFGFGHTRGFGESLLRTHVVFKEDFDRGVADPSRWRRVQRLLPAR